MCNTCWTDMDRLSKTDSSSWAETTAFEKHGDDSERSGQTFAMKDVHFGAMALVKSHIDQEQFSAAAKKVFVGEQPWCGHQGACFDPFGSFMS